MANISEATLIDKLAGLKERFDHLNKSIVKEKSKEAVYLPYVANQLGDVERFLLPQARKADTPTNAFGWLEMAGFVLASCDILLKKTEDVVTKFGPDFDTVGW